MKILQRNALVASPPTDRARFAFMVREFVSFFYPGTEPSYGLSLFDEHITGLKEGANARRRVWAIRDEGESVGFLVATQRINSSVKLGPLVIEPSRRGEGHALYALDEIASFYEAEQRPYLYATYPKSNAFVQRLIDHAGWDVAGAVRGLYRDDEEVLIHRALPSGLLAPLVANSYSDHRNRLVTKRGGSVLLRINNLGPVKDIMLEGRTAALEVRSKNRVCFSRVAHGMASALDADQEIQLVDGTTLVVWR